MRIVFILIFLPLFHLNMNAQVSQKLISNSWYFSDSDTLFFSQAHVKENKLKRVKQYRTDKKYSDTAMLMSEYSFDSLGSLTKAKTYDIHGSPSVTEFKMNAAGKMTEVWVERKGALVKTRENIFNGNKLIKELSFYAPGHVTSIEYNYGEDGLLSSVQYLGAQEIKGARIIYGYDSLKRLISEVTHNRGDTIGFGYFYKYDNQGRKYYTEYKEAASGWKEIIDYPQSAPAPTVEKFYLDDKLIEIKTTLINQQGLIEELITDRRMSSKRRSESNTFCGYSGPARYYKIIYEYDSKGNCISESKYFSPNKKHEQIKYTLDSSGNLIYTIICDKSVKDSEWSYSYD